MELRVEYPSKIHWMMLLNKLPTTYLLYLVIAVPWSNRLLCKTIKFPKLVFICVGISRRIWVSCFACARWRRLSGNIALGSWKIRPPLILKRTQTNTNRPVPKRCWMPWHRLKLKRKQARVKNWSEIDGGWALDFFFCQSFWLSLTELNKCHHHHQQEHECQPSGKRVFIWPFIN